MKKQYPIICAALALSAVLLSGCTRGGAGQPAGKGALSDGAGTAVSEPAAAGGAVSFEGTDLAGNTVSSDIFSQSKLTMLNVWATYCNPCLREMPELGELAAEYDASEVQIIGIVSDVLEGEDQELVEGLVEQTGANYPHLLLNESIYNGLLTDVAAVPTTFFLDKNGVVLDAVVGAKEKAAWEDKINGLLEGL